MADNYYAALNSAVFSDGSFVYIPKGVRRWALRRRCRRRPACARVPGAAPSMPGCRVAAREAR